MQHVSIVPTPPLAEFVERFWYSKDAPPYQKVRIAPTGTMELVFNLDDDELGFYDAERPGKCDAFSGAVFSGAHGRPLFVDTRRRVTVVTRQTDGLIVRARRRVEVELFRGTIPKASEPLVKTSGIEQAG